MSTVLLMLYLFAAEQLSPNLAPPIHNARFANVVMKIYGDADLRQAHLGYWSTLQSQPAWLEQEAVWWELMRTPDLGPLLTRADEYLQAHPQSQALHDQFYVALSENDALREQVESFERAALDKRGEDSDWLRAMVWLRANSATALPLLQGITPDASLPEALKPYAVQLMRGTDWNALRDPIAALSQDPIARERLLPWWQKLAEMDAQQQGMFSRLAEELARRPHRFWAIYRREMLLAEQPHLRDWVRWLHRSVRRSDMNPADYLQYLAALRTGQESSPLPQTKSWPPEESPPALGVMAKDRLPALRGENPPKPERPKVQEPNRPEVPRPERPAPVEMRQSERMRERN